MWANNSGQIYFRIIEVIDSRVESTAEGLNVHGCFAPGNKIAISSQTVFGIPWQPTTAQIWLTNAIDFCRVREAVLHFLRKFCLSDTKSRPFRTHLGMEAVGQTGIRPTVGPG
jgi:hypothetical protein